MNQPGRRLRIAVLNRVFSPTGGGAERYSIALVEQLAAKHEIHVFAQQIEHAWPGVTYHQISSPITKPRWFNQLWFATATWLATRKGFDVVHSHENTWHGDVQTVHVLPVKHNLFNGRKGLQLAFRWVKVLTSPRLLVYLWLEHMRFTVRDGRRVVVISATLQTFFAASYPKAMAMTSLITPGIDLPLLPITSSTKQIARQQLGLPHDKACALFVANDFRKKGLTTLIKAIQLLTNDSVLAVVGFSAQLTMFRQQVELAGLSKRVFFIGPLKEVTPAYQAVDCLVHPTLEDTFAMVVLEAMAHGLPTIVSSAQYCGISSLLKNETTALILDDPRNEYILAAALTRLLADKSLGEKLGESGRNFARQFEWIEIASKQDQLYQSVKNR
ncbi:MAG: glycosyltransferase family 4 protein [Cytophaga sp.]|nr:glycosyltransferase family 4 protein [Undibacterium sp.]